MKKHTSDVVSVGLARLVVLLGYAAVCLCLQMAIDHSALAALAAPPDVEVGETAGRLKRVQTEWMFVQDRLGLVEHDLGSNSKGQPLVGIREYCLDTGGAFYILMGAIGTTTSHDAYAADAKVLELIAHMRASVVQLTSPCWLNESPWKRAKMRAILASLKNDRNELLARLKEL